MTNKQARADVAQIRQTTQFTCCAASIAAALKALGKPFSEEDVNTVLKATPMAGATWEAMLATVQYFGCRGSLIVPATPRLLKTWTDQGLPVLIAWNPENRPWSHASVVFDVVEEADGLLYVHVMDPNIPNPSRTVRILNEDDFCQKWGEKVSDSLILRRPAMVIEQEVTPSGRQVVASVPMGETASLGSRAKLDKEEPMPKAALTSVSAQKDPNKIKVKGPARRNPIVQQMIERGPGGAGVHHNRDHDVEKGKSRKEKHKKPWREKEATARVADRFLAEQE